MREDQAEQSRRERADRILCGFGWLGICAVLGIFLWPMLDGRVYVLDDLGNYTLIGHAFHRESLLRGDEFVWWPYLDGGLFVHGLGQLGLYHPLHYALYRAIPLPWSFSAELFLSYPFLLVGMVWLLRRWQLSAPSALFGGMPITFSGFSLLHHVHTNVVAVAAHIPWLLVMIDIAMGDESPRRRAWALLGMTGLTASQLLLHFPQVVVMSVQLEVAYVLALGFARGRLWRSAPWLLSAKLLAILIARCSSCPPGTTCSTPRAPTPRSPSATAIPFRRSICCS